MPNSFCIVKNLREKAYSFWLMGLNISIFMLLSFAQVHRELPNLIESFQLYYIMIQSVALCIRHIVSLMTNTAETLLSDTYLHFR